VIFLRLIYLQDHHGLRVATDGVLQVMSQLRISVGNMSGLVLQTQENIAERGQTLVDVLRFPHSDSGSICFENSLRTGKVNHAQFALEHLLGDFVKTCDKESHNEV
jgi:hypothetical protein